MVMKPKIHSSIYTGVSWSKNSQKWEAYFGHNYKNICLGFFGTELKAAQAVEAGRKQRGLESYNQIGLTLNDSPLIPSFDEVLCLLYNSNLIDNRAGRKLRGIESYNQI